jgi:hypothetical protein
MYLLWAALLFMGRPFWDAKPPEQWTLREIDLLRSASPWAQAAGPAPQVLVYLATAAPIEDAEAEARLRGDKTLREPDPDYSYYLVHHRDTHLVLAVAYAWPKSIDPAEERRMEEQCVMIAGRKTIHMAGHFPPTAADPVLRLVFPREMGPDDKSVVFRLYLPGLEFPDREVEFRIKDLLYRGKSAL